MKKILLVIGLVFAISCSKDETTKLSVQVNTVSSFEATISWSFEGSDGQTLYKLLLNDNVIEEAFSGSQYTFMNLEDNVTYNGVVFAISQDGNETFQEFSFTTELSLSKDGNFLLDTQQKADDFFYTEITGVLSIKGSLVQDLSNLASLEAVGELRIQDTNLSNLAGLQNLTQWTVVGQGRIFIEQNSNLEDISALNGLPPASLLFVVDSPSLNSLGSLSVLDNGNVKIKNCGIQNIESFSNISRIASLELTSLPNLTSLEGLNNLAEATGDVELASLPLVSNFSGLGSLQSAARMSIFSSGFTSFSGANSLQSLTSLSVSNSALIDFSGLENLTQLESLAINNCSQLENLAGLTGVAQLEQITVKNSGGIQNMTGLNNLITVDKAYFENLSNLTDFAGLNSLSEVTTELLITDLPNLTSFEGLNNLSTVRYFLLLRNLDQITSLQGLDNFEKVTRLFIDGCEMLSNLDGTSLFDNYYTDPWLKVEANPNLSDLCGFTTFAINGAPFEIYSTLNNAYNPNYQQIIEPNLCSQ